MRRLKTGRRPPIYPKTPGHLPCSSLTHPLPLPSRRPSVSFGGFGFKRSDGTGRQASPSASVPNWPMVRAQYEVTVFLFRRTPKAFYESAIFLRSDLRFWQGVAGGGEDDETPLAAAKRESREEAGIAESAAFYALTTTASIPVTAFHAGIQGQWPEGLYVIPGYYFAVDAAGQSISLSSEHSDFRWVTQPEGESLLHWDQDKTALWELDARLRDGNLPGPSP